jgi:hypothetical protein
MQFNIPEQWKSHLETDFNSAPQLETEVQYTKGNLIFLANDLYLLV